MAKVRLQGEKERQKQIYYEFDSEDQPLGEGGMGRVYKGRCVNEVNGTSKDVAIKFVFADLPTHAIERARREASIQLRNDNLVEMLGFIETSQRTVLGEMVERYHVVSELLEGVLLDDLLNGKVTDQKGRFCHFAEELYQDYLNNPCKFATTIVRNVLSGLMALHDAGYIHRDIDPTNIMITSNGHIKLIDFGIAKSISKMTTYDKSLTNVGVHIGKPEYSAPELVLGDVKHQNVTTDVYAVGILFYQLYMRNRPFEGTYQEVLDMQLHKKAPLYAIPRKDVRTIIGKAIEKKQERRYQSVTEFRVDLDKLPPVPPPPPVPFIKWLIGGCVAAILVVCFLMLRPGESPIGQNGYDTISYHTAVSKLKNVAMQKDGLLELEQLSNNNDYDATYLLARLYRDPDLSKETIDVTSDSIAMMRRNIESDYQKAHILIVKAVDLNPNDCNSLYDLACDYLIGDRKKTDGTGRDLKEAKICFERALELAKKSGNQLIKEKAAAVLEEYAVDFQKVNKNK